MKSLVEKEIYAFRTYVLYNEANKKIRAKYWFLKYNFYRKKNEKEFFSK